MLRVVEHYVSTQGEGPRTGAMTQFVRFAGCNLKCPAWPCDTPFAIDPKLYREEQKSLQPWTVAEHVKTMHRETGAFNICLTGGEPFLQNHFALETFLRGLKDETMSFEAFTNGTFEIPEVFFDELRLHPVMDWKLPGSGEDTWVQARARNVQLMSKYEAGAVKFTVANESDFRAALDIWKVIVQDLGLPVFVGPVWGKIEPSQIVEYIKEAKVPWYLNVQVHNYIYGAQTRGT